MRRPRLLKLVAAILVLEAIAALAFPARMPRAARIPTAGTALVAALALWFLARQNAPDR
jgi:Na+/H+ antiporter NhaD/arsenite permease-like protein